MLLAPEQPQEPATPAPELAPTHDPEASVGQSLSDKQDIVPAVTPTQISCPLLLVTKILLSELVQLIMGGGDGDGEGEGDGDEELLPQEFKSKRETRRKKQVLHFEKRLVL